MNLNKLLKQQTSSRKLRLFAIACCNQTLHLLKDQRSINAVKIAERYADGLVNKRQLRNAYLNANTVYSNASKEASASVRVSSATSQRLHAEASAIHVCFSSSLDAAETMLESTTNSGTKVQKQIAEDIFHPTKLIVPTSTLVLAIAKNIYEHKEWSDMSILADALEDASYTGSEVLDHLRSNQPHCWVFDLILDKH